MPFVSAVLPTEFIETAPLWFVFSHGALLTVDSDLNLPRGDLHQLGIRIDEQLYLGIWEKTPCFAGVLTDGADIPKLAALNELRALFGRLDDEMLEIAGHAFQLLNWKQTHKYCGRCGCATKMHPTERAMLCDDCGLRQYPRISPAVIVAVTKGDKILLGHNERFPPDFYSVLAGFTEAGENLEQCLRREIREESGIEVKSIRYFGSQPWPYPNSLMIAFTAEYSGGELKADGDEITDVGWYEADSLPASLPYKFSIASKLIQNFVKTHKK